MERQPLLIAGAKGEEARDSLPPAASPSPAAQQVEGQTPRSKPRPRTISPKSTFCPSGARPTRRENHMPPEYPGVGCYSRLRARPLPPAALALRCGREAKKGVTTGNSNDLLRTGRVVFGACLRKDRCRPSLRPCWNKKSLSDHPTRAQPRHRSRWCPEPDRHPY